MIGFIDYLRLNGFVLGPAETEAALNMMSRTRGNIGTDRHRLKTLLTSRHEEWKGFDALFEAYWLRCGREHRQWKTAATDTRSAPKLHKVWRDHLGEASYGNEGLAAQIETKGQSDADGKASGRLIASKRTAIEQIDLRQFVDPDEIVTAETVAYRLALSIRHRLSRRWQIARRGARLDLRRTIHANIKHGGDQIDLRSKSTPYRPVRIVVFLDVSGSMKHYSRFFLQFVKGLVRQWADADAYLVHTRLIRVTDALRDRDAMRAMTRMSLMAEGFGGGTKLGKCLAIFNDQYAKKALNSRTVVMVLSDGYEVGPPDKLADQLRFLKRRARRLVWLNPLLGWRNYEPVTAAMTAALPYIDHFAVANTLEGLAAIEPDLAKL